MLRIRAAMNNQSHNSTAGNEAAKPGVEGSKLGILALFAAVLLVSSVPYWVARWCISKDSPIVVPLIVVSVVLMLVLPFAVARWLPRFASFDRTWLPRKWPHVLLWLVLVVVLVAWAALGGRLIALLGLWVRPETLMRKGWMPIRPASIVATALLFVVLAPLAEEVFWRGYALQQFERIMAPRPALLGQAVLYSVLYFWPVGPTFVLAGYGLILGAWRQRMRSLLPLVAAHMLLNALCILPFLHAQYETAVTQRQIAEYLEWDVDQWAREVKAKPAAKAIDLLREKPDEVAIPALIQFLSDADRDVRVYAASALVDGYGRDGCTYYAEALQSTNPQIVGEILMVVWISGCRELIPEVRAVLMDASSLKVQVSGLHALDALGDLEGLRLVAAHHPSEAIRRRARQMLGEE